MELNHVGTRTLKTTRLVLRPFYLSDAQAMYDNWRSEEHTSELQSLPPISYAVFCLKKKFF